MVLQSIRMALKAITANKTRSFLTMLGIIIGVFSLVVLVSLVNGATSFITTSLSSFGSNHAEIQITKDKGNPLDDEDLADIQTIEEVKEVTPYTQLPNVTFVANGKEVKGTLYASTSISFRIENFKFQYGRGISAVDEENHIKVAVLTYDMAKDLYGNPDAVGKTISVNGVDYDVIGVIENKEGTFDNLMFGNQKIVYIPFSCYTRQPGFIVNGYNDIMVSFEDDVSSEEGKQTLNNYFYKRFERDKDAYLIVTQEEVNNVLGNITSVLGILFGGIAAISLLVGGIGIMNIMLVSVTERTKEIGIRKAIGADKKSIMLQFMIEAFVISLAGCFIGLIFSYLTIALVNAVVRLLDFKLTFQVPFGIVFLSAGFSLLVGLVFGIYPANKAASKKPIEALRYDG